MNLLSRYKNKNQLREIIYFYNRRYRLYLYHEYINIFVF